MDARAEVLLYAAARRQHVVQTLRPALAQGRIILCDRYVDSSLAYQGGGRKLGLTAVRKLNDYATRGLNPDLTFYFRIPFKLGLKRIKFHRKNKIDRLDAETLSFHQRVAKAYLKIARANPDRVRVIDSARSTDQVVHQVLRILKSEFKL